MKLYKSLIIFSILLIVSVAIAFPQKNEEINIWPATAPGYESATIAEENIDRGQNGAIDRVVSKIKTPTLTVFIPKSANGSAAIICPGGAYVREVIDKEGTTIAKWLNTLGITAFVLKYRLPSDVLQNGEGRNIPLQDAQRAIRHIRANASKWRLDTSKIGIMGFSAGGHLAATLSTDFAKKVYNSIDPTDEYNARPNFAILAYPVISMGDNSSHLDSKKALLGENPSIEICNEFSSHLKVTAQTPKTFIVLAENDKPSFVSNSLLYFQALKDKGIVGCELHIFTYGGHGFGLSPSAPFWGAPCKDWLKYHGLIQ